MKNNKNEYNYFKQWNDYLLGGRDANHMCTENTKNQKGENIMTKIEKLEILAAPISEFLSENFDTGYKVIIDCDNVDLLNEVASIELQEKGK